MKGYKYNYKECARLTCEMTIAFIRGVAFGEFCKMYKYDKYHDVRMLMGLWNSTNLRSFGGMVYRRGGMIYVGDPKQHKLSVAVLRTDKKKVWAA